MIRVTTDLTVPDIEGAKAFYADYFGLEAEDMGLDWVIRFVVPGLRGAPPTRLAGRDGA